MRQFFSKWRHLARLFSIMLGLHAGATGASAAAAAETAAPALQIAFLPDVHFHDLRGDVGAADWQNAQNGQNAENAENAQTTRAITGAFTGAALMRTMAAQLQSTRLFNENYFALKAALDDLVRRQVRLVVLPGDFSDDGQPVHVKGLAALLQRYQRDHGMRFVLTFGNHDPVTPFGQPAGKADFLGADGQPLAIFSAGTKACPAATPTADSARLLCREAVRELGYAGLMEYVGAFGLLPQPADHYWETPFSHYPAGYRYDSAKAQAGFTTRQSRICRLSSKGAQADGSLAGNAVAGNSVSADLPADNQHCAQVPDSSYLLEPVPGLWLLALDANVYLPNADGSFSGSGNAGYNAVLGHKPYLVRWIADVVKRAKAQHKTLISFSHFPMSGFYQGQELKLAELLSDQTETAGPHKKAQLARLPATETSQTLAALGLTLHIGGHMHLNNTAVIPAPAAAGVQPGATANNAASKNRRRTQLVNVQAPSLAAYRPAYKLLTLQGATRAHLETIELRQVPDFNQLFPRYQQEWQQRARAGLALWDREVLQAKDYGELTDWHLRELVRSRFLPNDWPAPLRLLLQQLNGQQLLLLSLLPADASVPPAAQTPVGTLVDKTLTNKILTDKASADQTLLSSLLQPLWQSAPAQRLSRQLAAAAAKAGVDWAGLAAWQGDALVLDLYRLQNAGALALADISPARLAQYRFMAAQLVQAEAEFAARADTLPHYSRQKLTLLLEIVNAMAGAPAYEDLWLDLSSGAVLTPEL